DNLIVVITSDHGEEFLEHGDLGHGHTLFDELIRIPLQFSISEDLSKANNWEPQTHDFQVRQMDVLPTIIEMCGIDWDCDPVQLD
ncbi:MAG: sulfatase-like hydrolase/transferase, partial [Planctomycetota bacterium]|nr:sulfatase-like hydrolase/transferase [Planctomycetota bacterium]